MTILQIKPSVPSSWKIKLDIFITNKNTFIEKTTCKDFYWHIINTSTYNQLLERNGLIIIQIFIVLIPMSVQDYLNYLLKQ